MRILAIADEEDPALWDFYHPDRVAGIDLILSAGDLDPEYLSFLVTVTNLPLLYVHGNHDGRYEKHPPEGCTCIDGSVVRVGEFRILGLGGCLRYSGGEHQYTERQMKLRILKLAPQLCGGVDLLLTHAPARGIGDLEDPAHRGFDVFLTLLDRLRPRYMLHGHVHRRYVPDFQRSRQYGQTQVVNANGKYIIEL